MQCEYGANENDRQYQHYNGFTNKYRSVNVLRRFSYTNEYEEAASASELLSVQTATSTTFSSMSTPLNVEYLYLIFSTAILTL